MIAFNHLPHLIDAMAERGHELQTLKSGATSKAVGGVLASRCAFEVNEHIEEDGFDILACRDVSKVGLPIPGPFAVVCVETSNLPTDQDAQRRVGAIIQRLKYEDLHSRPAICIATGDWARLSIPMRMAETHFTPFTLIQLLDLLLARPPRARLLTALVASTPLRELNPYIYKGPVHGPMFIGRRRELEWITGMKASYALVGPRTMGKSSLVHRASEVITERNNSKEAPQRSIEQLVIITEFGATMSESEMTREIIRRFVHHHGASHHLLSQDSPNTVERLVEGYAVRYRREETTDKWISCRQRELLIIIDEADALTTKCPRLAESLRRCHDREWAKIVLVGYKDLRRSLNDVKNSPLMNVCQELPLDSLSITECGALVMEPMLQLGITFDNLESVIQIIHREAGGAPSRIQLLCHHLVDALSEVKRRLTPEMAADAIHLAPVQSSIRNWYRDSTTALEKWIAGVSCSFLPCDEDHLHTEIRKLFPELSRQIFDIEIGDLITANVFTHRHGGLLDFSFPALKEITSPERTSRDSMQTLMQQLRTHLVRTYGGPI